MKASIRIATEADAAVLRDALVLALAWRDCAFPPDPLPGRPPPGGAPAFQVRGRVASMRRSIALLLLFLGTACASARVPPPSETAVRAAMQDFMAALNALDVEGMAKFFADDITAFVPSAQPERAEGKPAVVEIFRRYVETTRATTSRTNLVPEDLLIDVRGETAVVSFHVRGANAVARRTFIFHEQDGRWLITHFHASSFSLRR